MAHSKIIMDKDRCLKKIKMKDLFLIVLFLSCCISLHAQNGYFPLKGKVISADSLSPVPDAHILSELSHYGTTSDFDGKFQIPIRKNDTLRISSVGFVTKIIDVNCDIIDINNFEIIMERDTVMLQEVDVFPYLDNHYVEEIISRIPITLPEHVMKESEIDINIQNYYYNKTKDLPRIRGWHFVLYNPIKKFYDRFNKKERLYRKLERNRRRYEKELLEEIIIIEE